MDEKQPDNLVGMPEPDPPEHGPDADPDTPDPADLVPGLGGTTEEGTYGTSPPPPEEGG